MSALPRQPDSLSRLMAGAGSIEPLPELGPEARIAESRLVFPAGDRAVRITPAGGIDRGTADGIDRAKAMAIAFAARDAVPKKLRPARQSDAACQVSNSAAERFVGLQVQLRRDYRVKGALTCIWGTLARRFRSSRRSTSRRIPEAETVPPPGSPRSASPATTCPRRANSSSARAAGSSGSPA